MDWWFVAIDVIVGTVVAWLLLNILASLLRACGATWARLPNLDFLGKWVALALSVLSVAPRLNFADPVLRNVVLGYVTLCLIVVGMSVYGRFFVLPRLNDRLASPRGPVPDRITTGIFEGWSARVARRTCTGAALFVLAGSVAEQLFVHGYAIFGALTAVIALYYMPHAAILLLAPWLNRIVARKL
jgi:hypothetical protein